MSRLSIMTIVSYFLVEDEAGQIEHIGQVRKREELYQRLYEDHPDEEVIIVK